MTVWYIGSDNLVTLDELYDELNEAYINSADSVIGQFFAYTDTSESTQLGSDITFSYVADTDGQYRGVVLNGTSMTQDLSYVLKITVTEGSYKLIIKLVGRAQYHG